MKLFKTSLVLLALACSLSAATAMAHDKDVDRTLFIQIDDQGLVALWSARGSGQRVELQGKMVDVDRDGKLSDGEKKLLAASMLQKGTAGITIDYAGQRLTKPKKFETKLKDTPPGAKFVEAAGMASYEALGADQDSLAIEIIVEQGYGPVTIQVQTLGERFIGWVNRAIVAPDRKGLTVPVLLKPEQKLKVVVVKGKAPEPKVQKGAH